MLPVYNQTLITHRNSKPLELPIYPQEAVNQAHEEIKRISLEIKKLRKKNEMNQMQDEQELMFWKGKIAALMDTIYRIKRFLLILHEWRTNRIQEMFWAYGGQVRASELPNLSNAEKQYLLKYQKLTNNYIDQSRLELTVDLDPPLDSVVEVRVINDCGEILGYGDETIRLQKNSVHFLKKKFVEKFIQKGDIIILK